MTLLNLAVPRLDFKRDHILARRPFANLHLCLIYVPQLLHIAHLSTSWTRLVYQYE